MDRAVISIETANPFCALGKEGGDILHADAGVRIPQHPASEPCSMLFCVRCMTVFL
jgi:hypothetical protein